MKVRAEVRPRSGRRRSNFCRRRRLWPITRRRSSPSTMRLRHLTDKFENYPERPESFRAFRIFFASARFSILVGFERSAEANHGFLTGRPDPTDSLT